MSKRKLKISRNGKPVEVPDKRFTIFSELPVRTEFMPFTPAWTERGEATSQKRSVWLMNDDGINYEPALATIIDPAVSLSFPGAITVRTHEYEYGAFLFASIADGLKYAASQFTQLEYEYHKANHFMQCIRKHAYESRSGGKAMWTEWHQWKFYAGRASYLPGLMQFITSSDMAVACMKKNLFGNPKNDA